jgi:NADH-quinone oxidoreductase subunit E
MSSSELQPDKCAPEGGGTCRCRQAGNASDTAPAAQSEKSFLATLRNLFRPKTAAAPTVDGIDLTAVDALVEKQKGKGRGLIELLQDVSEHYHYLPPEALQRISQLMNVPPSRLYSIATFYQDFKLKPQGKHRLVICTGTACHVKGAAAIVDVLCRELNLKPGETTQDGKITLSTVNCIGLCGVGPVATLDGKYLSELTPEKALELVKQI